MSEPQKRIRKASEKVLDKNNAGELQLSAHQNARIQQQFQQTQQVEPLATAAATHQSKESSSDIQNQPLLSVQPVTATQKSQKRKTPETVVLNSDEEAQGMTKILQWDHVINV